MVRPSLQCGFSVVPTSYRRLQWHLHRRVSIRHADFRWFQPKVLFLQFVVIHQFQSAMRIFGGSNLCLECRAVPAIVFQSAMRIFGVANLRPGATVIIAEVSIRHADFRCFQRHGGAHHVGDTFWGFNPPCGFSVFPTLLALAACSARLRCFNPPCGFSVFPTVVCGGAAATIVQFQSAMRIFGVSNAVAAGSAHGDPVGFTPPCGFSVFPTRQLPGLCAEHLNVSIRHADFRCSQQADVARINDHRSVSIRHADFRCFQHHP